MADDRVAFVQKTLLDAQSHQNRRLKNGLALRAQIGAALNGDGPEPDHYRVEWLRASTKRMLSLLGDIAREFNKTHPEDACSTHDFVDILATTIGQIKKASA